MGIRSLFGGGAVSGAGVAGVLIGIILLVPLPSIAGGAEPSAVGSRYQEFLDRFVSENRQVGDYTLNLVDYAGIVAEREVRASLYRNVLEEFAAFDTGSLASRQEKIAFWINAYNIGAVKMIIDHFPTDSIRSTKINWLKNPWKKKILNVGGTDYSLHQIEHEILLKNLGEPLVHFGVVCASLSCPELAPEAYRPDAVMEQLRSSARRFLNDPKKGIRIDRDGGVVWFSQIFKFDTRTFPEGARSAVPLVAEFLPPDDAAYLKAGDYTVNYLDYDWSLNALGRAR